MFSLSRRINLFQTQKRVFQQSRFYKDDEFGGYPRKSALSFDVDSYSLSDHDKTKWREYYKKTQEQEDAKRIAQGKKPKKIRKDLDLEKEFTKNPAESFHKRAVKIEPIKKSKRKSFLSSDKRLPLASANLQSSNILGEEDLPQREKTQEELDLEMKLIAEWESMQPKRDSDIDKLTANSDEFDEDKLREEIASYGVDFNIAPDGTKIIDEIDEQEDLSADEIFVAAQEILSNDDMFRDWANSNGVVVDDNWNIVSVNGEVPKELRPNVSSEKIVKELEKRKDKKQKKEEKRLKADKQDSDAELQKFQAWQEKFEKAEEEEVKALRGDKVEGEDLANQSEDDVLKNIETFDELHEHIAKMDDDDDEADYDFDESDAKGSDKDTNANSNSNRLKVHVQKQTDPRPYGFESEKAPLPKKTRDEDDREEDDNEPPMKWVDREGQEVDASEKSLFTERTAHNLWVKPAQQLIAKTRKHKILSNLVTIDFIDMITHSRRKRDQKIRRDKSVLRKYKEKKWKKYGHIIKASWAKREEKRILNREIRLKDPNWFYYREINFWIHKKTLLNNHIRRAIPVLLKNPSFTNPDKKKALEYMVKTVEEAENTPQDWYDKRASYYKGVPTYNRRNLTTIDRTCDPDFKFPETYEELIAKAEESMLPSDKATKYSPPPFKPREKQAQQY